MNKYSEEESELILMSYSMTMHEKKDLYQLNHLMNRIQNMANNSTKRTFKYMRHDEYRTLSYICFLVVTKDTVSNILFIVVSMHVSHFLLLLLIICFKIEKHFNLPRKCLMFTV